MYVNDDEDELQFGLHYKHSNCETVSPNYNTHDHEIVASLVHVQMFQEEQKHDVFEATKATICRNNRSYIKNDREILRSVILSFLKTQYC